MWPMDNKIIMQASIQTAQDSQTEKTVIRASVPPELIPILYAVF